MKTLEKTNKPKRNYTKPQIERVIIDNEISLVMQSTPPGDPEGKMPDFISNGGLNPFKIDFRL